MSGLQRWIVGGLALALVLVTLPFGPTSRPAYAQSATASFATQMMQAAAKGAASAAVNQVFGWVLGSAGSANGDVVVLNEILDELDTIENTLQGIENEIAELINSIDQLDCDTWVQQAEPMVNAISNLWDPNSASPDPGGPPPPQQSYVGIVAETKNNTVSLADMEAWADQVLNNNGQGIDGKSIQDHLQDLSQVLIPPAGGSGIIKSCLTVPANGPSNFDNQTDDTYYDAVVVPLVDYYYAIQTQGMTMVVDALNFEAWQAAGSPISDSDDINDLPMTVCNGATGDVAQFCENADWVVLGSDGKSGVRGRVAAQLTLGGAPYTTIVESQANVGVQLYTGSTNLWPRNVYDFTFDGGNDFTDCNGVIEINSHAPCGVLVGIYSNPLPKGTQYFGYGSGFGGVWRPASGPQLTELLTGAPNKFSSSYTDVADYLMKERGFKDLPSAIIFITDQVHTVYPVGNSPAKYNVLTFTDTGLTPEFHEIYNPSVESSYFNNEGQPLMKQNGDSWQCGEAFVLHENPDLPATLWQPFYQGEAIICYNGDYGWNGSITGWSTDNKAGAASAPQYRMPVIDVTTLTCNPGLSQINPAGALALCTNDQTIWLNREVPPADDGVGWALDAPDGEALVNAASLPNSIEATVVSGGEGLERVKADGSLLDVVTGEEIDVSIRLRRDGDWYLGHVRVLTDNGWTSTTLNVHEDSITAHEPNAYARIEFGGETGNRGQRPSGVITVRDFS